MKLLAAIEEMVCDQLRVPGSATHLHALKRRDYSKIETVLALKIEILNGAYIVNITNSRDYYQDLVPY